MSPRRTCPNGHVYNKSSDCPVCPICEKEHAPKDGWLSLLSAPARRAVEEEGISDLKKLAQWTEKEVLALHGVGPASLPVLREALTQEGLEFKKRS